MAARTLPGLGLKAFFALGEDGWNDELDVNFLKLSVLVQGGVINVITTKPGSPSQGDVYILSSSASDNPNTVAVYDDGTWKHFAPSTGWTVYNRSNDSFLTWTGSAWASMPLAQLRAIGALANSAGVIEQKNDNSYAKRAIGVAASTDLLSRADGDGRYSLSGHTHAPTGVTAFNTRTGAVTLSSSDVTTALGFTPQTLHAHLTAISGLGESQGLIEQTGTDTFAKRTIGVSAANNIPTVAMADARYQTLHATLTGLSNVVPDENGVVEQFGPRTFRIRSLLGQNSNDLLTRGSADSLYVAIADRINRYSGSITLALVDAGAQVRVTASSTVAVTVPNDTVANFPEGTRIDLVQAGTGALVIQPGDGAQVDFRVTKGNKTAGQHAVAVLVKHDANQWVLFGDLTENEDIDEASITVDTLLLEADNIHWTADEGTIGYYTADSEDLTADRDGVLADFV